MAAIKQFLSKPFFSKSLLSSSTSLQGGLGYSGNGNGVCGVSSIFRQNMSTIGKSEESGSELPLDPPPRIKFKAINKTARHIMQIIDREAVAEVKAKTEIPEIKPGYIIELKLEVPENRRRVSTIKGIVIARRNAGLNTTIRVRRMVAGVGIESLLPLYSPNIKEVKVLEMKKVRRAKLYYLRDRMNEVRKLATLPPKGQNERSQEISNVATQVEAAV